MKELRLIDPTEDLKKEYLEMIKEWKESGEQLIPWRSIVRNNFSVIELIQL